MPSLSATSFWVSPSPPSSPKRMRIILCSVGESLSSEAARERFIVGNMRLVLSLVRRFWAKKANADDVFQAGCVGLIKAIDNFDVSVGVRFSTYNSGKPEVSTPQITTFCSITQKSSFSVMYKRRLNAAYYGGNLIKTIWFPWALSGL